MRKTAICAILEYTSVLIFPKNRIARAVRIWVHRAVAEQAVKGSALHALMAGKIFAVSVLKKTLAVFHLLIIPFLITPRHLLPQQQDLLLRQPQKIRQPAFFDLLITALLHIPADVRRMTVIFVLKGIFRHI